LNDTGTKDAPDLDVIFPNISSSGPATVHIGNQAKVARIFSLLLAAADSGGRVQLLQDLASANSPVKFTSDPPTAIFILSWDSAGAFDANNTFLLDSDLGPWGSTQCGMEFFNLTIRRDITSSGIKSASQLSGDYSLEEAPTRNEGSFVATMWSPLLSQQANMQLAFSIYSYDFSQPNGTLVMAHISQQLSRIALGMFAGTLKPVPAVITKAVILGRYPVAPVLTYVGLLVVYSFIALGIFLWAALLKTPGITMPGTEGKTATALQLAQVQVTDPLIVVAQSFERELKRSEEKRIETSEVGGT
ncbi:hypothetical protein BDN72DRAFT_921125, partial [Pluteus cervinus]